MKLQNYFNFIALLILSIIMQAHAQTYELYIQNYTGTTMTAFYKYCNFNPAFNCSTEYASGKIANNSFYIIPANQNSQAVVIDKVNTDDNWVFVNPTDTGCMLYLPAVIPQFANISKSLVSPLLQCATTVGKK